MRHQAQNLTNSGQGRPLPVFCFCFSLTGDCVCSKSSADINHIHRHRGRLFTLKSQAKVTQNGNVKGRDNHAAWRLGPQDGPSVNLGTNGSSVLIFPRAPVRGASSLSLRGLHRISNRREEGGILGENALVKFHMACLWFTRLRFHVLACCL